MERKASFRMTVTRREMIHVGDEVDHTLMLVEMEGEPINFVKGAAGDFVYRRSVNYHDRVKGSGAVNGYAITSYQEGTVFSRFEGKRDAQTKLTSGTWKTYKGTGKLANIKGHGKFSVKSSEKHGEFILEMDGEYKL
jgi:hypothetical protein